MSWNCRILKKPTEELKFDFDLEHTDTVKQPSLYARCLMEFCSFKALHLAMSRPNFLADKDFSRLTFDMMLAWEEPGVENETLDSVRRVLAFYYNCLCDSVKLFSHSCWRLSSRKLV